MKDPWSPWSPQQHNTNTHCQGGGGGGGEAVIEGAGDSRVTALCVMHAGGGLAAAMAAASLARSHPRQRGTGDHEPKTRGRNDYKEKWVPWPCYLVLLFWGTALLQMGPALDPSERATSQRLSPYGEEDTWCRNERDTIDRPVLRLGSHCA